MVRGTAKESKTTLLVILTRDSGRVIRGMVTECMYTIMELNMREIGRMALCTVMESILTGTADASRAEKGRDNFMVAHFLQDQMEALSLPFGKMENSSLARKFNH